MRERAKNFLAAFGVALLMGSVLVQAQTTKDVSFCGEEYLRSICGEYWHDCYFLYGCWLIGATPATSSASALALDRRMYAVRNVRFR